MTAALTSTPLQQALTAANATLGEYCGATTALHFGDYNGELSALLRECGVFDLGYRAKIALTGPDRVRWTNGMVTNNTRDLLLNRGNYSFVLNTKGRITGDLWLYNRGEFLIADTDRAQVEELSKIFDHFIVMDDVQFRDVSDRVTAIGLEGPLAARVLDAAGISVPAEPQVLNDIVIGNIGLSILRKPNDLFELWLAPGDAGSVWDLLLDSGATPVGAQAIEAARILRGNPRFGPDLNDDYLPQETEQKQALHFNKGCYIGQEIVERINARAILHRGFGGFELSEMPAELPLKLTDNDKPAGALTSAVRLPEAFGNRIVGLGYIRLDLKKSGTQLHAGSLRATVASLPISTNS